MSCVRIHEGDAPSFPLFHIDKTKYKALSYKCFLVLNEESKSSVHFLFPLPLVSPARVPSCWRPTPPYFRLNYGCFKHRTRHHLNYFNSTSSWGKRLRPASNYSLRGMGKEIEVRFTIDAEKKKYKTFSRLQFPHVGSQLQFIPIEWLTYNRYQQHKTLNGSH